MTLKKIAKWFVSLVAILAAAIVLSATVITWVVSQEG
jgi:hypothetical protein